MAAAGRYVIWFEEIGRSDVPRVGGKNASLGEMVRHLGGQGVAVPPGFATTADAYRLYVTANGLEETVAAHLRDLKSGRASLAEAAAAIRRAFLGGEWPPEIEAEIREAYRELGRRAGHGELDVAVRSSATAEDLPDASFAGPLSPGLMSTRSGLGAIASGRAMPGTC